MTFPELRASTHEGVAFPNCNDCHLHHNAIAREEIGKWNAAYCKCILMPLVTILLRATGKWLGAVHVWTPIQILH